MKFNTKYWQLKLLIVSILIYSSIITPPDVLSLIIHSSPLIIIAIGSFWLGSKSGLNQNKPKTSL